MMEGLGQDKFQGFVQDRRITHLLAYVGDHVSALLAGLGDDLALLTVLDDGHIIAHLARRQTRNTGCQQSSTAPCRGLEL